MNVEDLKAKQHQLEVRYSELQSEMTRLQGEWRAYGDMITKLDKDSASTIVVEEKGKDSGK